MASLHCSENYVPLETASSSLLTFDEKGISLSILFSLLLDEHYEAKSCRHLCGITADIG